MGWGEREKVRQREKRYLEENRVVSDRTAKENLGYPMENKNGVRIPKANPSKSYDSQTLRQKWAEF